MIMEISYVLFLFLFLTSPFAFSDDKSAEVFKPKAVQSKTSSEEIDIHPGQVVFETHCSKCHGNRVSKSPSLAPPARSLETFGRMIPGIVERALLDGRMKAQASMLTTQEIKAVVAYVGEPLFKFDTVQKFDSVKDVKDVKGVSGQGVSIDSAFSAAADNILFVNSGYGMFGQVSGNVLLAFKPKGNEN